MRRRYYQRHRGIGHAGRYPNLLTQRAGKMRHHTWLNAVWRKDDVCPRGSASCPDFLQPGGRGDHGSAGQPCPA